MSWVPRRCPEPSHFTCASGIGSLHTTQRNVPPRPIFVGGGGSPAPVRTLNWTGSPGRSSVGSIQARAPFFFDSQNELTSGATARQAGLGQATVRAHNQAI